MKSKYPQGAWSPAVLRSHAVNQQVAAKQIMAEARISPLESDQFDRSHFNADEAVEDLGLSQDNKRFAAAMLRSIVVDNLSMIDAARSARTRGFSQSAITEMLRRGARMVQEAKIRGDNHSPPVQAAFAKAGPSGSVKPPAGFQPIPKSSKGGFRKRGSHGYTYWYPGSGLSGDPHESEHDKTHAAHSQASPKREVAEAFMALKAKADVAGIKISGSPGSATTMEHIDSLGKRLDAAIVRLEKHKAAADPDSSASPPPTGDGDAASATPEKGDNQSGELTEDDFPDEVKPASPEEVKGQVESASKLLDSLGSKLDDYHKPLHDQLQSEAAVVAESLDAQHAGMLESRVRALAHMVTGMLWGTATGGGPGMVAGLSGGSRQALGEMQAIRGLEKEESRRKDDEAKKGGVFLDTRTGQVVFKAYTSHGDEPKAGDAVENTNPKCKHFGSKGVVVAVDSLSGGIGKAIRYRCTNSGPTWKEGDVLRKTPDQLDPLSKSGLAATIEKAGPFIGPRGGKWADSAHKIPWKETTGEPARKQEKEGKSKPGKWARAKKAVKKERKKEAAALPDVYTNPLSSYNQEVVGDDKEQAALIARKMADGISKAADVCKMSPPVCADNKNIPRSEMPQLLDKTFEQLREDGDGWKVDAAIKAGADPNTKGTLFDAFLQSLKSKGVSIDSGKINVGQLKATQREIKAGKTFGMADAHLRGKYDPGKAPIVVSKDNYILDGHHRYAAMLTIAPDRQMNIIRVDAPMDTILKESFKQPGVFRADMQDNVVPGGTPERFKGGDKTTIAKAGPFIGPRGGKWADAKHTIAWREVHPRTGVIPIDEAGVHRVVDELLSSSSVNRHGSVVALEDGSSSITFRDAAGDEYTALVHLFVDGGVKDVRGAKGSHRLAVAPKFAINGKPVGGPDRQVSHRIILMARPNVGGGDRDAAASILRDILAHELTHASDPGLTRPKKKQADAGLSGHHKDQKNTASEYYNRPHEVRASMQQIRRDLQTPQVVNELRRDAAQHAEDSDFPMPLRPQGLLDYYSARWRSHGGHFTEKNRRKVLTMVAALRDAILEGSVEGIEKAGPFIGPRGGKWADAKHTIAWKESKPKRKAPPKKVAKKRGAPGSQLTDAQQARLKKLGVAKLPEAAIPLEDIRLRLTGSDVHERAVISWKDRSGRPQNAYTPKFHEASAARKWQRIEKFRKDFPKIKRQISRDLKKSEPDSVQQHALIVANVVALTGLRPGSVQSLEGRYGVFTLQKEHVKITGNKVEFKFVGKSGKVNTAKLTNKAVADAMRGVLRGKKRGDRLFRATALTEARKVLPEGMKIKDFRTIVATNTARDVLDQVVQPPPLTGNKAKDKRLLAKALLAASREVAKKLNNTATVARASYVHPEVFKAWAVERAGADPELWDEE